MSTKVFGESDDLIEFEGDVSGEVGCYGLDDEESGAIVFLSDATVLNVWYGDEGIWKISVKKKGSLFATIDVCTDEDADLHSDVAHFNDGLKWAYFAKNWEKVK